MERKYPHLFSPFKIRNTTFRNRIIAAPLGAWTLSPSNYIVDYAISMFEAKAAGGAAEVTFGHTEVNAEEPDTDGFGLYFNLRKREGIAALSEFAAAIKQHGALASLQLNYSGYYGPSESTSRGKVMKAMTEEKIMQTISQYVDAAKKLKLAGFDICMIHGAHGWLPMQFLSAEVNHRNDKFGGSLENRMRFPLMLVDAIREAIGNDMLIEYRVSGYDPVTQPALFEESVAFIQAIEKKVDLIHVSSGAIASKSSGGHTFPTYLEPRGLNIPLAAALKKRISLPVAVVGNITEPEMAERILAEGQADFVALCRSLIADPEWPNKVRRGQESDIRPCLGCYNCLEIMHHNHYLGCDVNPRSGREHRFGEVTPAKISRKVIVVGGGPAGMQAAITAAERGHQVTLYEKTGQLGGILKITDNDPLKTLVRNYKDYLVRQVAQAGVTVKLNTEAVPEMVESRHPDVVIVASGSRHIVPAGDIPGVDRPNVFTAISSHQPGVELGNRVVIIGGNLVGCETALFVSDLGKEVTVVEMTAVLHADANFAVRPSMRDHLDQSGVHGITGARCTGILAEGVRIEYQSGKTEIIPADSVILAVGMRSNSEVFQSMYNCAAEVIPIGDCVQPGTIRQASRTGYFSARDI